MVYYQTMRASTERKVVIALWSAGSCGRKQLAGILRYVNSGKNWDTHFIMDPKELTAEAVRRFEREGVNGFIVFVSDAEAAKAIARSSVPTVLVSYPTAVLEARKRGIILCVNDNAEIGRTGAEHFLALGQFADYGFVPDRQGRGWSPLRERAFTERLAKDGKRCRVFKGEESELPGWLKMLRRPAAVMAPFDFRAKEVMAACHAAALVVPNDVAILGVDDDELVCENVRPALSSVHIDQEMIGYRVAEELAKLMNAKTPPPSRTLVFKSGSVVARESTRPLSPVIGLVRRVNAFLGEHWAEPISVEDVAKCLRVSRRLLDLRYREATGHTVRQALEDRRIAALKRLLRTTKLPIARLTMKCGFANGLWAKYVFKRREGMTMSRYREAPHVSPH